MKTTELHLAARFTLPIEVVTDTFALLAKRGLGKTSTAVVPARGGSFNLMKLPGPAPASEQRTNDEIWLLVG